jgi:hypothetical protein
MTELLDSAAQGADLQRPASSASTSSTSRPTVVPSQEDYELAAQLVEHAAREQNGLERSPRHDQSLESAGNDQRNGHDPQQYAPGHQRRLSGDSAMSIDRTTQQGSAMLMTPNSGQVCR